MSSNLVILTDTLRLLDGIIDIYMLDIKFSDDHIAEKYLKVKEMYKHYRICRQLRLTYRILSISTTFNFSSMVKKTI
jgi:uncharacterized Fe-S radical SAM superfamily protein PflX